MKRLIAALLLFWSFSALAYDHVRWTFADYTDSPLTIRRVNIQPLYTYTITGTNFNTGDRRTYTNTATGTLVVSNIVAGSYAVEFVGPWRSTWITNTFWGTNGLIDAKDYTSVATVSGFTAAYSQAVADLRFIRSTNGNGTNLTVRGLTMPVGAVSNYVWTATNTSGAGTWRAQVAGGGSFDTTQSNAYNGTFTGNAAGLTNYGGPEVLLFPKRVGFGTQQYPRTLKSSDFFLGGEPATAGIILALDIQWDVSAGAQDFLGQMRSVDLQIFTDCGSATNNASLTNPVVSWPAADFFGNRFRFTTNGQWAIEKKAEWIQSQDHSTNLLYGGPIHRSLILFPMPYSNGCVVRLQHRLGNTNWAHGYIGAIVDKRANLDALGEFASWRFRTKTNYGGFTGGSASNFLFSTSTPSLLVGWHVGAFDNTESGNVSTWTDSRGLQIYTATGNTWMYYTDDTIGSTYAGAAGVNLGNVSGVVNFWAGPNNDAASQALEGYRYFGATGMYATNSATFSLSGSAAFTSLVGYSSTVLYYAP